MVVAIVGVRKLFDFFPKLFTQRELSWLDDVVPEASKKHEDNIRSRHVSRSSRSRNPSGYENSEVVDISRTTSKGTPLYSDVRSRHKSTSSVRISIKDLPMEGDVATTT